MPNKQSNFDKILLALAALSALGGSGYLYTLSKELPSALTLPKVTPKNELPHVPIEDVKNALANLTKEFDWHAPIIAGKQVPLCKSITVVQKNGEQFDLYTETPQFREPMTNKFLIENGLDFLAPNVGELDPDEDGFNNLEEFLAKTNPKDATSHPPFSDHLYLVERVQDDYVLSLFGNSSPYTVRKVKPAGAKAALISNFPQDFGFEVGAPPRFRALKFEAKSAIDPKSQLPTDASEMTILDTSSSQEFVLAIKQEKNLAAFQAKLQYRHKTVQNLTVKKGDNFRITGLGSTFKLMDVLPDSAVVTESQGDGKQPTTLTIKLRP